MLMGDDPRRPGRRALRRVACGKRYVIYESTEVDLNVETSTTLLYVRSRDDESSDGTAQRGLDVIERIEDEEGARFITSLAEGEGGAVLYMFMYRRVD